MTVAATLECTARKTHRNDGKPRVSVGILALQGAFIEHSSLLRRLGAEVREVRLPEQFDGLDGIILPGGESTAMALIGERWGVFPRLRQWVSEGRPVWGTCAGMILLSDSAFMTKLGGQSLVGGLNVEVCRNYFGAQTSSFEVPLDTSKLGLTAKGDADAATPYPAVFIRAPAILEAGAGVDVLCKVRAAPCQQALRTMKKELEGQDAAGVSSGGQGAEAPCAKRRRLASYFIRSPAGDGSGGDVPEVIVAVRKGYILATAFHPELTNDSRWHAFFLKMVRERTQETLQQEQKSAHVIPVPLESGRAPACVS